MENLKSYSNAELQTILKFSQHLVDNLTLGAEFIDGDSGTGDPHDDDGAVRQAKEFAEARNGNRRHIRSKVGETEDDRNIRDSVRKWLRKTNRGQK